MMSMPVVFLIVGSAIKPRKLHSGNNDMYACCTDQGGFFGDLHVATYPHSSLLPNRISRSICSLGNSFGHSLAFHGVSFQ